MLVSEKLPQQMWHFAKTIFHKGVGSSYSSIIKMVTVVRMADKIRRIRIAPHPDLRFLISFA